MVPRESSGRLCSRRFYQKASTPDWPRPLEGNKDTLYRIHGTNQPEYIGQAISSGCIRMTNEDVIDLVNRVKPGAIVVVLPPARSAWMGAIAGSRSGEKAT